MSELIVRLEKLRFIAEELRLAFALSRSAPDAWNARLLARHVLIRAADFIEHARRARRVVRTHGSDRDFHAAKETYAGWFDEYFKTARNRLGAHVQDLDFGRRIELWNDIEIGKIGVFVDGASQIYGDLAALNLPGYVPMASTLTETTDPTFLAALEDFRRSAGPARAEFANDALGPTRPGTLSGSGFTPVHGRASQLSLVSRWIDWDMAMLDRFSATPSVRRIIAARLVTDVVSFADCLITRPVSANAPQAMDGLDRLMAAEPNGASSALAGFLSGFRFQETLDGFRSLRDEVGGHLEQDPAEDLSAVLSRLNSLDDPALRSFAQAMRNAFHAACGERVYLSLYRADGARLRGGVPNVVDTVVEYDPASPVGAHPGLVRVHEWTEREYVAAIDDWLRGDADRQEGALDAFRTGFGLNRGGENFRVHLWFGAGERWEPGHFSMAHRILLRELLGASSPERAGYLLDLLLMGSRSHPSRVAETLVRYAEAGGPLSREPGFVRALGAVAEWYAPRYAGPLREAARVGEPWSRRSEAILGLHRSFIRDEGLRRINQREQFLDYAREMEPFIAACSPAEELEVRLASASVVRDPDINFMAKQFEVDFRNSIVRLVELVSDELERRGRPGEVAEAKRLLAGWDCVGVVLLLSRPSAGADYRHLLDRVRDGTIVPGRDASSATDLIRCLWLMGERVGAVSVAERLVERYPGDAAHELLLLELLDGMPFNRAVVLAGIARIRREYRLTPDLEARAGSLEAASGAG